MNTFNVIIQGNYDDIRGDAVVYLLERVASGSCKVWVSGTTGSVSGNTIINHKQGNFTASVGQMGWTGSYGDDFINRVCNSSSPAFDIIIYPKLEGDWTASISSSLKALSLGIPIFTPHYNDTSLFKFEVNNFYGFFPSFIAGWGNYLTGNSGSCGNQLEFIDSVIDGANLSQSILLYGDNKGLITTENSLYLNNYDVSTNSLYAPVSLAAKYINLIQALSSSYASSDSNNYDIYTNYNNYLISNNTLSRQYFNYDLRQYLREVSTFSSSIWTPQQGFGMAQIQNYTGSSNIMPNLTSSYNLSNLGAGTPLYINVISQSVSETYTFTWQNFLQSGYKNTEIKINNKTVYLGTDTTFTWIPDTNTNNAVVKFYTNLQNGIQSIPDSNSIISLGPTKSQVGVYEKLNYGYACANDGNYIAVSSTQKTQNISISGIVDILQYNKTTNTYTNKLLLKKLANPLDYTLILATEDNTIDINDNSIGNAFITTELSSSYDILGSVTLGTEQSGSASNHQDLLTESGNDLFVKNEYVPYDNNPLDLEADSVFNLIDSYSDNFGASLSLNNSILAVGCPNFLINYSNGDIYSGGSVDIFDLNNCFNNQTNFPTSSISSPEGDATFGESVSLSQVNSGSLYLAIGSSTAFDNYGAVYIYQRNYTDNSTWNLIQTIYGPSQNGYFGGKVKFEQSGTDYTLVVGNSNTTNSNTAVYVYSFSNGTWTLNTKLTPNHNISQTLPYLNNLSPIIQDNLCDGFGNSVAIYGDKIIVGSPTDTIYSEFAGGDIKTRGAVYFYNKCINPSGLQFWNFIQKTWGDIDTLVNNKFGFDIDITNNFAVVTVPKNNVNFTANYIINTLNKKFDCNPNDLYYDILGQVVIFKYDSINTNWYTFYTQQKIKDYGYPYLNYGYSIAAYNESFVVGAPCIINDFENLGLNFPSIIQGYSYVYNLNNLITNYPVGNVFYRDGKIILSNSGSIFNSLMKNKFDDRYPKYDLSYTGTLKLFEKQVVCTINPGEFNYSTNPTSMINNSFFGFKDLDLMLKYMNNVIFGNVYWWKTLSFNVVEQSLFNMYTENYDILNTSIDPYFNQLSSSYLSWDVDGNDKINFKDMTLIWKYFTNTLTQDDVFANVELKSKRKTLSDIQYYIQNNVIVKNYGQINPIFFQYDYSSSIDSTGSYLAPYITTIGLYNGADLVGVAKLAQPIKNGGEFPLNILIKWDF
jgi:hypothetical protein